MCEPIFLYDPQHFFELAQASARGQFHRPDHVAARAQAFLDLARRQLQVSTFNAETPHARARSASRPFVSG